MEAINQAKIREISDKLYAGGLIDSVRVNEQEVFSKNLLNDASNLCIRDLSAASSGNLTVEEKECVRGFFFKSLSLMNLSK